ncbi:unnamed protein product [Rotaria sp. Silwood1]|nr:unnamed protein product [Rotaria sp. Silwood1]
MQVHTKLNILDCRRTFIRAYKTLKLTGMKTRKDIEAFILKTYECVKLPFDIEIRDQYDGFVTLDDNYIDDYNPFNPNATVTTGVQPTNSATPTLILQIILFSIQQNEHTQQIDQVVSTSKSQTHCTISFPNNSKMAFIDDFNVNSEQRDQYISDAINVDTGDIVGKLSMIQAPKTSKQKYGSRLPRFKNWMSDKGERLELIIVAIEGAKKHPSTPLNILCEFATINESKLSHSSPDYMKSCLALVLQKDGVTQWKTLVLSNEISFTKNAPDQCSTRTKKAKRQDHSSTINLSINMVDSSMHINQGLSACYDTRQVIGSTSQTMLNALPSGSQFLSNSPQTNSLPGNTNSVYNIDLNDASVLQQMNTNGDILNNDPSLYDAADCNTNCPFCGTPGYDIICCYCGEFS